jgi:hypothetical protein
MTSVRRQVARLCCGAVPINCVCLMLHMRDASSAAKFYFECYIVLRSIDFVLVFSFLLLCVRGFSDCSATACDAWGTAVRVCQVGR